ncbi:hypothetical protein ACFQU1_10345 [Chelatococcus sp. GCM10030263]|uniref:hypothetical protein n=1 Tax=Chelatococcus sp. GCM10030263 TaxID=3273387 RepID=UPI003618662D
MLWPRRCESSAGEEAAVDGDYHAGGIARGRHAQKGDGSPASAAAQKEFDDIGAICREAGVPWVLLSGGAAPPVFERVLDYAYAAGASGFLAGRTIWLNAIRSHFPNLKAVAAALQSESVTVLKSLSALTKAKAAVWSQAYPDFAAIKAEGDFTRSYGAEGK